MVGLFKKLVISSFISDTALTKDNQRARAYLDDAMSYAEGDNQQMAKICDVAITRAEKSFKSGDVFTRCFLEIALKSASHDQNRLAKVSDTAFSVATAANTHPWKVADFLFFALDAVKNNQPQRGNLFEKALEHAAITTNEDVAYNIMKTMSSCMKKDDPQSARVTDTATRLIASVDEAKACQFLDLCHKAAQGNTKLSMKVSDASLNLAPRLTYPYLINQVMNIAAETARSDNAQLAKVSHTALSVAEKIADPETALELVNMAIKHVKTDPALPSRLADVAIKRADQDCEPHQRLGFLSRAYSCAGDDKAQKMHMMNIALAHAFSYEEGLDVVNAMEFAYGIANKAGLPMRSVANAASGLAVKANALNAKDNQFAICSLLEIAVKAAEGNPALSTRSQKLVDAQLSKAEYNQLSNETVLRYMPLLGLPTEGEGVAFSSVSRSFGVANLNPQSPVYFVASHKQMISKIIVSGRNAIPSAVFSLLAKPQIPATVDNFRRIRSAEALPLF